MDRRRGRRARELFGTDLDELTPAQREALDHLMDEGGSATG